MVILAKYRGSSSLMDERGRLLRHAEASSLLKVLIIYYSPIAARTNRVYLTFTSHMLYSPQVYFMNDPKLEVVPFKILYLKLLHLTLFIGPWRRVCSEFLCRITEMIIICSRTKGTALRPELEELPGLMVMWGCISLTELVELGGSWLRMT